MYVVTSETRNQHWGGDHARAVRKKLPEITRYRNILIARHSCPQACPRALDRPWPVHALFLLKRYISPFKSSTITQDPSEALPLLS